MSTVLAFDSPVLYAQNGSQTSWAATSSPSLQKEIETQVALSAQKVWANLVSFMQGGLPSEEQSHNTQLATPQISTQESLELPVVRPLLAQSESAILPAFADISADMHRESIEVLASIGILKGGEYGKYYPQNHVRTSDFVRVIVDLYRFKLGYSLDSQNGLNDESPFAADISDPLLRKKLRTAHALWLLDNLRELQLEAPIHPVQAQQIINNTLNLNPYIGQKEKISLIDLSSSVLTKSQMAGYLVAIFQLEKSITTTVFNDISNHRYHSAITKLAQLGVVAGKNGNFYPDNYVLRSDGIIMIANSLLAQQWKALIISDFIYLPTIDDTTYFAAYAPHLEYLLTNEIWDFLLHPQQSGYLFLPTAQLTKWEAYTLLSQAARVKLLNVDPELSSRPITRWELADLIVNVFEFVPSLPRFGGQTAPGVPPDVSNHYVALREEKKWLFVSFLKDVLDTL